MDQLSPQAMPVVPVEVVLSCLGDVLDREPDELDADRPVIELGLESFTAVRLRRRLREDVGLDLPLTAFLAGATARSLAAGVEKPLDSAPYAAGPEALDHESFPLTPVQEAYLVGRDPAFPMGGVATFYYHEFDRTPDGDPAADLARLAAAWDLVVQRHPMLRMVIGADARGRVLAAVPRYEIAQSDLRAVSSQAAEHALAELRRACLHQVRPADRWPLFDIRAALLPDGHTRVFVGFDVLALDLAGWMQVMREWGRLADDPHTELAPLPVTFAELVRRRHEDPAERRRREIDLTYWLPRAPQLPPGPALPWAKDAAEIGIPHFTRHADELSASEWSALRQRATRRGLSPTGLLLAAFGLVLHRWGATEPCCLNTTLFDRADAAAGADEPGLAEVIGDFTSTILVQLPTLDLSSWSGVSSYAEAVNRQFWADLGHRSVSGVEVMREAARTGAMAVSPGPAHPVVFTSGVGLAGDGEPPARWLGEEIFGVSQTPQVLLDHIVWDEAGRLRLAWDAVDDALPDGFVPGMLAAHARLLRRLARDEQAWTDPALAGILRSTPTSPSTSPRSGQPVRGSTIRCDRPRRGIRTPRRCSARVRTSPMVNSRCGPVGPRPVLRVSVSGRVTWSQWRWRRAPSRSRRCSGSA